MRVFNTGLYNIAKVGMNFNDRLNVVDEDLGTKKGYSIYKEIAPYYHDWLLDFKTMNQALTGGRACTKSSFNAKKIALKLLLDKNCSVVVIRKTFNTHVTSTFAELKKAMTDMGISFRYTVSPLRIYCGNNTVYFNGLDDYEKLKGFTDDKSPIKLIWFFEITEMESKLEIDQVKSSLARGDKEDFISLYEWNPHFSRTHWTYEFADNMKANPYLKDEFGNVLYDDNGKPVVMNRFQHNIYTDLPNDYLLKWLGKFLLMEIEALKRVDYEMYKHIYLGEPARLSGTIYKKFKEDIHVTPIHSAWYDHITIGIDYGDSSATVGVVAGWSNDYSKLEVFDEYYHSNKYGNDSGKDVNDYVEDIIEFVKDIKASGVYSESGITLIVDSAASSFYNLLNNSILKEKSYRRTLGDLSFDKIYVKRTNKKKKDKNGSISAIQERINITNMMFYRKGYIKIDPKCKNLIEAFGTATYDEKTDVRKDNESFKLDPLDAFEYTFLRNSIFRKVKNALIDSMRGEL